MDKEKLGLPFVLRKSMDQLDGKPFLAGKEKDNKAARLLLVLIILLNSQATLEVFG